MNGERIIEILNQASEPTINLWPMLPMPLMEEMISYLTMMGASMDDDNCMSVDGTDEMWLLALEPIDEDSGDVVHAGAIHERNMPIFLKTFDIEFTKWDNTPLNKDST